MPTRRSVLAILLGVLVALSLAIGSYSAHVAGPNVVGFDGVALYIRYLNDPNLTFGPAIQNSCNETFPAGPPAYLTGPECPQQLVGGDSYDLWFFEVGNPGISPGLWANMTVEAPFDFQVNPSVYGQIPTSYSSANGTFVGGDHFLYGIGEWTSWVLAFTFPTNFTSPTGGLWLHADLTVQLTNETTVPDQ